MNLNENKKLVLSLLDTFKEAGDVSLVFRKRGLKTKIKSDNTPVSNGDLEVNKILTKKISELTPNIPIISEEASENKSINNLECIKFVLKDLTIENIYKLLDRPKPVYIRKILDLCLNNKFKDFN